MGVILVILAVNRKVGGPRWAPFFWPIFVMISSRGKDIATVSRIDPGRRFVGR